MMFPARCLISSEDLRIDSLEATKKRFTDARALAIAHTERLGELYAALDENDADEAAMLADAEIEVANACARYEEALKRVAWETRDAERILPKLPTPNE